MCAALGRASAQMESNPSHGDVRWRRLRRAENVVAYGCPVAATNHHQYQGPYCRAEHPSEVDGPTTGAAHAGSSDTRIRVHGVSYGVSIQDVHRMSMLYLLA